MPNKYPEDFYSLFNQSILARDLEFTQVTEKQWQIGMKHDDAKYYLRIIQGNKKLTFAAELFRLNSSNNPNSLVKMFAYLMDLNSKLSGVHIASAENSFFLRRVEFASTLREQIGAFDIALAFTHETHKEIYYDILEKLTEFDIQIVDGDLK
jgi:hypothetical protein